MFERMTKKIKKSATSYTVFIGTLILFGCDAQFESATDAPIDERITSKLGVHEQRDFLIPEFAQSEWLPAGGMTAKQFSNRTYIDTGRNLSGKQRLDFWTGFSLFRDPWVIAPSSTEDRDGLGPLFNTRSCISCHSAGARGPAAVEGISTPSSLVIRLGLRDGNATQTSQRQKVNAFFLSRTFQYYGEQIQPRAIKILQPGLDNELKGEAKLDLKYKRKIGQYADGTSYTLRSPSYQLTSLAFGELDEDVGISPRLAPPVFGGGLLDAIDEQDLLNQEDVNDRDNDGISAKYNIVNNAVGRFGLKGKHPTLKQQVAAAFRDDIGITNNIFPSETCSRFEDKCHKASKLGGHKSVEIPDKLMDLVIKFNTYLAVPPARNLDSKNARAGRSIFYQAKCDVCHKPNYTTDKQYPIAELAGQKIWPYTDLALHDMGQDLADNVTENSATGREWKTPPLWGLGLRRLYKSDAVYLHDGRAQSIEEAILWHGGEATASQQHFTQLDANARAQLLAFLDSI